MRNNKYKVRKVNGEMSILNVFSNISNIIIPLIVFYVIAMGVVNKQKVYENFISGAADGFKTVIQIMPTLIGLMVAVGILRASGFLEFLGQILGFFTEKIGLPADIVPLALIKMFSSSAATGLVLDIFKTHGTDSYVGLVTSIMMSCTETVFYTMSVYFMAAKVTKTRYTLQGALLSTLAGIIASIVLAGMMS